MADAVLQKKFFLVTDIIPLNTFRAGVRDIRTSKSCIEHALCTIFPLAFLVQCYGLKTIN